MYMQTHTEIMRIGSKYIYYNYYITFYILNYKMKNINFTNIFVVFLNIKVTLGGGDKLIPMPGTLGDVYAQLGGKVKPNKMKAVIIYYIMCYNCNEFYNVIIYTVHSIMNECYSS